MIQVPIKVYSKKDVQNLRRLIREESYKWIDSQERNIILSVIFKELESHNITLSKTDRNSLSDYIEDESKCDIVKVKKELHKFAKNISEAIKNIPLDTLPESSIPSKNEEFNKKLYEESKVKVLSLVEKLKEAKNKAKRETEQLENSIENLHKLQLEIIDKQVEEIWKSNEEEMPEHFAMKELQMIHAEMLAERKTQELILERQKQIEILASRICALDTNL